MTHVMELFVHHAYLVLFLWVLIEQAGVPVPSVPVLLAAGTMSAAHRLHVAYLLPIVLIACLVSDSLWYWLGKRYGSKIINLLCKFSMEAATCVTRTQGTVSKRGAITLLFAKWVPGLGAMAPPIAGQAGVSYQRFLAYDGAGSLAWAAAWLLAGRFFGDVAKKSHPFFTELSHFAVFLVIGAVIAWEGWRLWKRHTFLKELRGLRLEPAQLHAMIADAAREGLEPPFIVDLRHPLDVLTDPLVLPGALRIGPDDLKLRKNLIPHDRDIVLYCTCPSEETSAKLALELRRLGVKRVRPLRGGLQGWKDAGYALDAVTV